MTEPPSPANRWFRWIYAAVVYPLWTGAIVMNLLYGMQPEHSWHVFVLALSPFAIPVIFWGLSWRIFGLAHSALGWKGRRRIPREKARWFRWHANPFHTYLVCPDGIGLIYLGLGEAYLPYAEMQFVASDGWTPAELHHTSPEIRSPVGVPPALGKLIAREIEARRNPPATAQPTTG
jgi:hypothetical protein